MMAHIAGDRRRPVTIDAGGPRLAVENRCPASLLTAGSAREGRCLGAIASGQGDVTVLLHTLRTRPWGWDEHRAGARSGNAPQWVVHRGWGEGRCGVSDEAHGNEG